MLTTTPYRCCSTPPRRVPAPPASRPADFATGSEPAVGDGGGRQWRRQARPDRREPNRQHASRCCSTPPPRAPATPSFAAQQTFATGRTRFCDGGRRQRRRQARPDRSESNRHSFSAAQHHRSRCATPSFATQQTFTTGSTPVSVTTGRPQRRRQAGPDHGQRRRQHGLSAAQHHSRRRRRRA